MKQTKPIKAWAVLSYENEKILVVYPTRKQCENYMEGFCKFDSLVPCTITLAEPKKKK